jgi:hypothetical protein
MSEVNMRLNERDPDGKHLLNNDEHHVSNCDTARRVDEERPSGFADTLDSDRDVSDFADTIIRQNQIVNRALRRQYRSRIARKAI